MLRRRGRCRGRGAGCQARWLGRRDSATRLLDADSLPCRADPRRSTHRSPRRRSRQTRARLRRPQCGPCADADAALRRRSRPWWCPAPAPRSPPAGRSACHHGAAAATDPQPRSHPPNAAHPRTRLAARSVPPSLPRPSRSPRCPRDTCRLPARPRAGRPRGSPPTTRSPAPPTATRPPPARSPPRTTVTLRAARGSSPTSRNSPSSHWHHGTPASTGDATTASQSDPNPTRARTPTPHPHARTK